MRTGTRAAPAIACRDGGSEDTNAQIWKSDDVVKNWAATIDERERKRAAQWQLMGELLPYASDEEFTFLDLGAGTGSAARAILALYPRSHAVLADFSPQMMDEGTRAMQPYADRFAYVTFDMVAGEWPDSIPAVLDAVVTSQCVHHIPDERKRGLFAEIHQRLAPGGWYLNFDPITSEDPVVAEAWLRAGDRQDPDAAHGREHRSAQELARHENHVRYMIPLEPQLQFLREAGFAAVDVYWKHLDYVVYGGCRSA